MDFRVGHTSPQAVEMFRNHDAPYKSPKEWTVKQFK
jgi:hypothetical protein